MRFVVRWDEARKGYAISDTAAGSWAAAQAVFGHESVSGSLSGGPPPAISRLYLGMHYLTDVLAGYVAGDVPLPLGRHSHLAAPGRASHPGAAKPAPTSCAASASAAPSAARHSWPPAAHPCAAPS